jgi:hypothetical protein
MKIKTHVNGTTYEIDLNRGLDIGIPVRREKNVACYGIEDPRFEFFSQGDFTASVAAGAAVNCEYIRINAHGNGTHTEVLKHVADLDTDMTKCKAHFNSIARLVTVGSKDGHLVLDDLHGSIGAGITSLIVRHKPNSEDNMVMDYTGTDPDYCLPEDLEQLRLSGIRYLLVDIPSVDPEKDGGALLAHKAFFGLPDKPDFEATITELIYVHDEIPDGIYYLQLHTPAIETDAVPSRPVIFELKTEESH